MFPGAGLEVRLGLEYLVDHPGPAPYCYCFRGRCVGVSQLTAQHRAATYPSRSGGSGRTRSSTGLEAGQ